MPRSPETAKEQARPRILLVEDEPGIVDFVQRGLQAEGFAVEAELDGIDGERRALDDSFDLVVLDLMLPGRGGLEILAALRQAKPRVPVIVLTAAGEIEDRVGGLDAGAVDYLVKPFSLAELAARVRVQLRLAEQTTAATLRSGDIEVNLLTRQVRRGDVPGAIGSHRVRVARVPAAPPWTCALTRADPQHRLGLPTRPRHQRRRRLHRLSQAQAQPPGQPRPDLHRAQGRLPPRRSAPRDPARTSPPALAVPLRLRRALAGVGLRWRLAAWVAVVMLVCTGITFVAVYRGTGSPAAPADRPGDRGQLQRALAHPRRIGLPLCSSDSPARPPATCKRSRSAPAPPCCS